MFPNCLYLSNGSTRVFFLLGIFLERNLLKESPCFSLWKVKPSSCDNFGCSLKIYIFLELQRDIFLISNHETSQRSTGPCLSHRKGFCCFTHLHFEVSKFRFFIWNFSAPNPVRVPVFIWPSSPALAVLCTLCIFMHIEASNHPDLLHSLWSTHSALFNAILQLYNCSKIERRIKIQILLRYLLSDITPVSYFHWRFSETTSNGEIGPIPKSKSVHLLFSATHFARFQQLFLLKSSRFHKNSAAKSVWEK